jgi:hypothetical protein
MTLNPTVVFSKPLHVEIEQRPVPELKPGQLLVRTSCTLISTGTELTELAADFEPGTAWGEIVSFPFVPGYNNISRRVSMTPGPRRAT